MYRILPGSRRNSWERISVNGLALDWWLTSFPEFTTCRPAAVPVPNYLEFSWLKFEKSCSSFLLLASELDYFLNYPRILHAFFFESCASSVARSKRAPNPRDSVTKMQPTVQHTRLVDYSCTTHGQLYCTRQVTVCIRIRIRTSTASRRVILNDSRGSGSVNANPPQPRRVPSHGVPPARGGASSLSSSSSSDTST